MQNNDDYNQSELNQSNQNNQTEKQKEKKKNRWIIPVLIIVIIILLLLLLRSCGGPEGSGDNPISDIVNGFVVDENAQEGGREEADHAAIQEALNQKVADGMINISMNVNPTFETGTSEGNLLIINSEVNNYPQTVQIVRKDTNEVIYQSDGILVGSKIEFDTLDVDLPAGTYECVAYFNNVDPNTGAILGTAGAEISVIVLG